MSDETILEAASRLVNGARQESYGHPIDDYRRVAKIWTGILLPKLKHGVELDPEECALMMAGLKISREVNRPKRDNRVDGAGYFQVADMICQAQGGKPCHSPTEGGSPSPILTESGE